VADGFDVVAVWEAPVRKSSLTVSGDRDDAGGEIELDVAGGEARVPKTARMRATSSS
jgi:hypothetical protein